MKNRVLFLIVVGILVSTFVWAGGQPQAGAPAAGAAASSWAPSRNVEWIVTSSPGGGSDIFSRFIADVLAREGIVSQPIVVSNRTDGVGEAARLQLSQLRGPMADHTVMAFNLDDMIHMAQNTNRRVDAYKALSIMAVDKHLLYVSKGSRHQNFPAIINAIRGGSRIVAGGSRGSDTIAMQLLMLQLNWTEAQMPYVMSLSSNDAIVSLLGNHIDVVISKPAAASPYVESGDIIPILALSHERFTGDLAAAPKLSEVGSFSDLEFPLWRGIIGSPNMSNEAQVFWSNAFKKVTETAAWKDNYIQRFQLIDIILDYRQSAEYMANSEKEFLAAFGTN